MASITDLINTSAAASFGEVPPPIKENSPISSPATALSKALVKDLKVTPCISLAGRLKVDTYTLQERFPKLVESYGELSHGIDLSKEEDLARFSENIRILSERTEKVVKQILINEGFEEELSKPDCPIALLYTGSDARYERVGLSSPFEFIIVTKELTPEIEKLISKVATAIESITVFSEKDRFFREPEVKVLSEDDPLVYTEGHSRDGSLSKPALVPMRAFDARLLLGNEGIFSSYKEKMVDSLHDTMIKGFKDGFSAKVKKELEDLFDDYSLKPAGIPRSVDFQEKTLFYDGSHHKGLKYGPLRVLQCAVMTSIWKAFKEKKIDVSKMPSFSDTRTIKERIIRLKNDAILQLDDSDIKEVSRMYTRCLILQARLEETYVAASLKPVKLSITDLEKELIETGALLILKKVQEIEGTVSPKKVPARKPRK